MSKPANRDPTKHRHALYCADNRKQSVSIYWTHLTDTTSPSITVKRDGPAIDLVFDEYDVDDFDELVEATGGHVDEIPDDTIRHLGTVVGDVHDDEPVAFFRDEELLSFAPNITDEVAEGLIDVFGDIPSIGRAIRRGHDAELYYRPGIKDRDWADDLPTETNIERGLKEAGVWQEPDDVVAGGW